MKKSEVVDFFIKEEDGRIVDAYTKLKKPLFARVESGVNILEAGSEIRSSVQIGSYANGKATIPVEATGNPDLELGCGGLPEHIANEAIGAAGADYFSNNPALAYVIHLHDGLKNLFKL